MNDTGMSSAPDTSIAERNATTWLDRIAQTKITDMDSCLLVGDMLKEVKRIVNLLEEETRPEIAQADKLHKALLARKKKWSDKFEEAEALAKGKISHFVQMHTEAGHEVPKIEGISISEGWTGFVVDESLIPREFLTPDLAKLKAITKALKNETSISGWSVKPVNTVAVRL